MTIQTERLWLLAAAVVIGASTGAYGAEKSLGPWDMSRVDWYKAHPNETTAKLKWCVDHNRGDAECGAAMQACNDLLKDNPNATCQSPTAH